MANIKTENRKWITDSTSVDSTTLIAKSINLYTNCELTGDWDAEVISKDKVILALATKLKITQTNSPKVNSETGKDDNQHSGNKTPDWCIIKKGTTITHHGKKYDWCPHHGLHNRENNKTKSDMYMPHPHNHEKRNANRETMIAQHNKFNTK